MKKKTLIGITLLTAILTTNAAEVWRTTPIDRIKVGGTIGEHIRRTLEGNVKKLDYEKDFLEQFRTKTGKKSFIGTGNVIEGVVLMAKYTGDQEALRIKNMLIDELIKSQTADGYIGCMHPEKRIWRAWDMEDVGFIIDGLVLDYLHFGNRRSLDAAVRAADNTLANWKNPPKDYDRTIYKEELQMGLAHAMWALYDATNDERYKTFVCDTFGYLDSNNDVVLGRDNGLRGHVCGYLDTCFAQLEMFRTLGDKRLLRQFGKFNDHYLRGNGGLITGLEGICECMNEDQEGAGCIGETCMSCFTLCTYDLALRTGAMDAALAGDVMERVLHNGFFAAQSRDGRKLRYYTPMTGKRAWWPTDDYCCPVNYRRVIGHLPEYVLYANDKGVLANLYAPAEASLQVGATSVAVKEETEYPSDGKVVFTLTPEKTAAFAFSFRVPEWCDKATAKVNGASVSGLAAGKTFTIEREWKAGDKVEIDFPMDIRLVKGRARQHGRCALMRGPLVYAINLSQFEMGHVDNIEDANGQLSRLEDIFVGYPGHWRVERDDSVRDGGTAIVMKGSLVPSQLGVDCDWAEVKEYRFKEFTAEGNDMTYFRIPRPGQEPLAVHDRLYRSTGDL